jgi:hypothetical protein
MVMGNEANSAMTEIQASFRSPALPGFNPRFSPGVGRISLKTWPLSDRAISLVVRSTGVVAMTCGVVWLIVKTTIGIWAMDEDEEAGLERAEPELEAYP